MEVSSRNELKKFKVIKLDMVSVPDDTIHRSVVYRFKTLQMVVQSLETRTLDVVRTVRQSNPSLGMTIASHLSKQK